MRDCPDFLLVVVERTTFKSKRTATEPRQIEGMSFFLLLFSIEGAAARRIRINNKNLRFSFSTHFYQFFEINPVIKENIQKSFKTFLQNQISPEKVNCKLFPFSPSIPRRNATKATGKGYRREGFVCILITIQD